MSMDVINAGAKAGFSFTRENESSLMRQFTVTVGGMMAHNISGLEAEIERRLLAMAPETDRDMWMRGARTASYVCMVAPELTLNNVLNEVRLAEFRRN